MSDKFLIGIARSPNIRVALSIDNHACARVVRSQNVQQLDEIRVPEPWSGSIENAPILFVSSNPSIDENDRRFSTWSSRDSNIASYFRWRFDEACGWVTNKEFNKVRFWTSVRARAKELLCRDPIPGKDFALTELVHCKSQEEKGVKKALPDCVETWLDKVMQQSAAPVVV